MSVLAGCWIKRRFSERVGLFPHVSSREYFLLIVLKRLGRKLLAGSLGGRAAVLTSPLLYVFI